MRFIFYSPVAFEKWDWRNSVEKGIGGSETSHVEMSWRLAARGHEVITYAPIPKDCPGKWRGTTWKPIEKANFKLEGIWILYRCPPAIDKFMNYNRKQKLWFMMQDWDYPDWTPKRIKRLDKVMTLCKAHGRDVVRRHPLVKTKLWLTSNGVKLDLIESIESRFKIKRNPKKIIFASSPDRGLKYVLESFQRAREYVSDLELHAFYGFNNLNKLIKNNPHFGQIKEDTLALCKQKNVFFRGRISQVELYKEWLSAGMWVYQTNFSETSCITSMEAQAMGAYPIVNPIYALQENVLYGTGIEGDAYNDPLVKAKFAAEIVRIASFPEITVAIRDKMMEEARARFSWENFVDQWEMEASGKKWPEWKFPFQLED